MFQEKDKWIFNSPKKDLLFLGLPGIIGILAAIFLASYQSNPVVLLYIYFVVVILDTGHIYTTNLRMFGEKRGIKDKRTYLVPLFSFLVMFLGLGLKLPYFFAAVIYFTIYHNIRQFYGYTRGYTILNKRTDKFFEILLYSLMIIPFIGFHFRDWSGLAEKSHGELFINYNPFLLKFFTALYVFLLGVWLVYEFYIYQKIKKIEGNRIISTVIPVLGYFGFLWGNNEFQILLPLLIAHGIPYFATMADAIHKRRRKIKGGKIFLIVSLFAMIFGNFQYFLEEKVLNFNYFMADNIGVAVFLALYLVPTMSHFIGDSFIGKKDEMTLKKEDV